MYNCKYGIFDAKICKYGIIVAKICKYALIDRFQGSAGFLDSAASLAALSLMKKGLQQVGTGRFLAHLIVANIGDDDYLLEVNLRIADRLWLPIGCF